MGAMPGHSEGSGVGRKSQWNQLTAIFAAVDSLGFSSASFQLGKRRPMPLT